MGPRKYRKRPIVIEAMRYDPPNNCREIAAWIGCDHGGDCGPDSEFTISTLEGYMAASPGDWIIKGVRGEFYPCKPEIFAATYDEEPEWSHDTKPSTGDRDD